ncbi:MAG: VWA domain-containing protein [Desulfobacterales bacterium]|nr:MAG: VWA domain-containing protein [Desulfobacterales bacterium]
MQKSDRETAAASLSQLPAEPSGRTALVQGLNELEGVLKGLSGKTVVYLFSDGGYERKIAGVPQ